MTTSEEFILQVEYLYSIIQDQNKSRYQQIQAKELLAMKLKEHCGVIRKKYNLTAF